MRTTVEQRETACETFKSGYRSSQIISKIEKCQHTQTLLMSQVRNVLRKWHPGSIVFTLTSFLKDRNSEVCKRTRMTRAPCRRRNGEGAVPRAEKFGELTTADHKVFNGESRNSHRYAVRGLCIATGQYSSFCGWAVDSVVGGFDHTENDDQDRGDEENGQKVETLEREEEVNGWRDNARSDTRWHVDEHVFMRHALRHLEPCKCMCAWMKCVQMCEKIRGVRGVLFTHPVGYSGSLSAVNETNCNRKGIRAKKKTNFVSSLPTPFGFVPPRGTWRWRPILPSCMLVNSTAGQAIFTWMVGLFNSFSWFVVWAIVHHDSGSVSRSKLHRPIFVCFVQSKIPVSFVSSLFLCSEFVCVVFFRKFIPLFALSFWPSDCELWLTINWISEKSIVNTCKNVHLESRLSYSISSTNSRPYGIMFVPRSCRVEHHG